MLFKQLVTVAIVGEGHAVLEALVKLQNAVEMAKSSGIAYEPAQSPTLASVGVYKEDLSLIELIPLLLPFSPHSSSLEVTIHHTFVPHLGLPSVDPPQPYHQQRCRPLHLWPMLPRSTLVVILIVSPAFLAGWRPS